MICLKRSQINDVLWNECIKRSKNPRIYALTWYLDSVCEEWYGITNADYDFVFPVPIARKWKFIPWVAQPPFCQQLGAFSSQDIDLKPLLKKIGFYPKIHLHIHALSQYPANEFKKNSLLNLELPYSTLSKAYSDLRRRELKKILKVNVQVKINHNLKESLGFWIDQWKTKSFFQASWGSILKKLVAQAEQQKRLYFLSAHQENKIVGVSLFLLDFQRVLYLGGTSIEKGVNTLMFDFVIQNFAEKVQYLDFEGSSIESIQRFYESWGNLEWENYGIIKKGICR